VPRPKNANAAATRARILEQAARLFAERGRGETSVRDIAGASGVSLATVHHYFGSKDELYAAAIDAMYEELEELRGELLTAFESGPASPVAFLEETVRTTYRFARDHLNAQKLVMRSVIDTGEIPEERREGFLLPLMGETAAMVSAITGLDKPRVALALHSINQLIVRYALIADVEAEWMSRVIFDEPEGEPRAILEDHLVYCARALLNLSE
jgi:AcrR family transcriptional regulator